MGHGEERRDVRASEKKENEIGMVFSVSAYVAPWNNANKEDRP